MTIWKPGMRCVCIRQIPDETWHGEILPTAGKVYTVRDVTTAMGLTFLRLVEIKNPENVYPDIANEARFYHVNFRPLSETRLDQFRQHLAPVDRERADA